ncbi:MAG: GNAT family N-acetyltransferase [Anaerolineaceae bacterium]|nr:GNAT family N-acetyltransferase [Anaerolineaceae bacterium]
MSSQIISQLNKEQAVEAADIFIQNYRNLRKHIPDLPEKLSRSEISQKINRQFETNPSIGLLEAGKITAYMTGFPLEDLKGKCMGVYSPEWAHAAIKSDHANIYRLMYAVISAQWIAAGWYQQVISLRANQPETMEYFFSAGFGLHVEDGIRSMQPITAKECCFEIETASSNEIKTLIFLEEKLRTHMHNAPIFLYGKARSFEEWHAWLETDQNTALIAWQNGQAIAFMIMKKDALNQAFILRSEQTVSINGAYTLPEFRGSGVMTALVNHGLSIYKQRGYERCVVDYETQNYPARQYWSKNFQLVCPSVIRRVDERIKIPPSE